MTSTLEVLSKIRTGRTAPEPVGERCEMCAEPVADEHQHVVNVAARQLMCVCRACYLLFTDAGANLRYRAVPDRFLSFPDFGLGRREWEALQIPVGVAFFFRNSALDRTVAFYPGPAGATESELDIATWAAATRDPRVGLLADDVEALLVRVPDDASRCLMSPAFRLRSVSWCPSTPATSSSADFGCCGRDSTAARRRATSSTASSPVWPSAA